MSNSFNDSTVDSLAVLVQELVTDLHISLQLLNASLVCVCVVCVCVCVCVCACACACACVCVCVDNHAIPHYQMTNLLDDITTKISEQNITALLLLLKRDNFTNTPIMKCYDEASKLWDDYNHRPYYSKH